jgi:hypothetical protein
MTLAYDVFSAKSYSAHAEHAIMLLLRIFSMRLMIFSAGLDCVKYSAANISCLAPFKAIGHLLCHIFM